MPDEQGFEIVPSFARQRDDIYHHPCGTYVAATQAAQAAHMENCVAARRSASLFSWEDNQRWMLDGDGLAEILGDNNGDAIQACLDVFELTGGHWLPSASVLESLARRQGWSP